jgi:AmiR/NasT family two-component response regulator
LLARPAGEKEEAGRAQRSTPDLLRNLRNLRVLVFHPQDADGDMLVQQLQRIGCQVMSLWPPLPELPDTADAVFCAVRPENSAFKCSWMSGEPALPVIAVINYENPTIIDAALQMGARAVITCPVRSSGILSSLALAKQLTEESRGLRTRSVSDADAYRIIREQAMSKRVASEEIARAIIHADGILSFSHKGGG